MELSRSEVLQSEHDRSVQSARDCSLRALGALESYGNLCLARNDRGAVLDLPRRVDIRHLHVHQVAPSFFAFDGQIEERKLASSVSDLKTNPDRPSVLRPERALLADDPPLTPSVTAGAVGWQVCGRQVGFSIHRAHHVRGIESNAYRATKLR